MNPAYLVEMTFVAMAGRRAIGSPGHGDPRDAHRIARRCAAGPTCSCPRRRGGDSPAAMDAHARTATGRLLTSLRQAGLAWADVADITLHVSDAAHAASGTPGHPRKPARNRCPRARRSSAASCHTTRACEISVIAVD